jgi:hypothetical protein
MEMAKSIVDLAELSDDELDERLRTVTDRVTGRFDRVRDTGRDLTQRELDLTHDDHDELESLRTACELRSAARERIERADTDRVRTDAERAVATARFTRAVESTPRPVESRGVAEYIAAMTEGRPVRVSVECRSITSVNAGVSAATAVEQVGQPSFIWSDAAIPFSVAKTLQVSGPLFAALVAAPATAETTLKPSMADPSLSTSTLKAFGITSVVSDQVLRFGVGAPAVYSRLSSEVIFSVNSSFVAALETSAGTPLAAAATPSEGADLAIGHTWAQTGARPTALLVNPADYASLSSKAAFGPGDTIAAAVLRFNGVPLIVSASITAGVVVAIVGQGFSAHATEVWLASLPDLTRNTTTLRAELFGALLQHDGGAAVAVTLTGAKKRA